jgi:hypothetical protein
MSTTSRLVATTAPGRAKVGGDGSAAGLTLTSKVHFRRGGKGRLELAAGPRPVRDDPPAAGEGRVPKVARLMALAIRLQGLLDRGDVRGLADLARAGHVSRARVTQVMNLLMLAPDLQEQILLLPPVTAGRDPVREWQLRPIAAEPLWAEQRRIWRRVGAESKSGRPRVPANPTGRRRRPPR